MYVKWTHILNLISKAMETKIIVHRIPTMIIFLKIFVKVLALTELCLPGVVYVSVDIYL